MPATIRTIDVFSVDPHTTLVDAYCEVEYFSMEHPGGRRITHSIELDSSFLSTVAHYKREHGYSIVPRTLSLRTALNGRAYVQLRKVTGTPIPF